MGIPQKIEETESYDRSVTVHLIPQRGEVGRGRERLQRSRKFLHYQNRPQSSFGAV
jgi:hypothetical protein